MIDKQKVNSEMQREALSIDHPWSAPWEEIAEELGIEAESGLPSVEWKARLKRHGYNRLRRAESQSAGQILLQQFNNILVVLLAAAAGVSFAFGETIEAIAILAVIFINAAIGFFTELRAVRSMEALRKLGRVATKVKRDGKVQEVSAEELVPGDLVLLEGGDMVTADVRLIEASKLQADESALTGESVPASKSTAAIEHGRPLAERDNMAFKGTAITRGAGRGIVVATGMNTELGHISALVEEAEEEVTPLEKRLDRLGQRLVWVTLAITALIAISGILLSKEIILILETAIALAVATVPEGLPIVATIALARGMWRMSRRNALVRRLSAVETLGSTTVILTDKTGTLTENQMSVVQLATAFGEVQIDPDESELKKAFRLNGARLTEKESTVLTKALETSTLCNNASLQKGSGDEGGAVGDPLEVALLRAASKAGVRRDDLLTDLPEVREVAFDPSTKMMATFHRLNGRFRVAVKGAPEAVFDSATHLLTADGKEALSESERRAWHKQSEEMAQKGLRILALGMREVGDPETDPYGELTLLGVLGLLDPPREDVQEAISACKEAGVRVVMVTGDQPMTAQTIASEVQLTEDSQPKTLQGKDLDDTDGWPEGGIGSLMEVPIFARVEPKQKLNLVAAYQKAGEIVAMTGDGVNDAPALKKADIGIAMGRRGTQVAREAADMVLKDDAFSTIVAAIQGGRVIFNNIRKFVLYLLSCNVSEIMIVGLASLANAPLPIRPLQILYLNLVTDVFPALALGVGEGDASIMKHPPRDPKEPVLTRRHWGIIGGYSLLITISTLTAFGLSLFWLEMELQNAVTITFLSLASAQLWHVFNMRTHESPLLLNEVTRNPAIWLALLICIGLLVAAVYLPGLSDLLGTVHPSPVGWALAVGLGFFPLIVGQTLKVLGVGRTGSTA